MFFLPRQLILRVMPSLPSMDGKAVGIFLLATAPFVENVNLILHTVSVGDGTSGAERQARKEVLANLSQPQTSNQAAN